MMFCSVLSKQKSSSFINICLDHVSLTQNVLSAGHPVNEVGQTSR